MAVINSFSCFIWIIECVSSDYRLIAQSYVCLDDPVEMHVVIPELI